MPETETAPTAPKTPTVAPIVEAPVRIETLATRAEDGEVDITQAILTAYREGFKDGKTEGKAQAQNENRTRKECWFCGYERNCKHCAPKAS